MNSDLLELIQMINLANLEILDVRSKDHNSHKSTLDKTVISVLNYFMGCLGRERGLLLYG